MRTPNTPSPVARTRDTAHSRAGISIEESNLPCAPVDSVVQLAHYATTTGRAVARGHSEQSLGLVVQLLLLVALSLLADLAVHMMRLPAPSNAVGMLTLFLLLHYKLLHLGQIDAVATLLVRHLAFFFIPIAVGLMAYRELLATTGAALLVVIAASAVVGMLVAGLVVQLLKRVRR